MGIKQKIIRFFTYRQRTENALFELECKLDKLSTEIKSIQTKDNTDVLVKLGELTEEVKAINQYVYNDLKKLANKANTAKRTSSFGGNN